AAEHDRAPGRRALEHADDVGPARRGIFDVDLETGAPQVRRNGRGDGAFTSGAGDERGGHRVDRDARFEKRDAGLHGPDRRLYHAVMTIEGRVAAITGASAGIGLATATRLAREGVAVVLGARRADRLETVAARIRAEGGRAEPVVVDVAVEADVERLVQRALDAFGRLDIMVCNAGFGYYGTVEDTAPDIMHRMMDVNFMGTFYGARAALPIFRRQGHGHLIIVSSIVGR